MARVYSNFFEGTLSSQLLVGATTMLSAALAEFPAVTAPDVAYLVIGASTDTREIVKITAHTTASTSATIERGQDSTTDRTWASGTRVIQAPIGTDFTGLSDSYVALSGGSDWLPAGAFTAVNGSPAMSNVFRRPYMLFDTSANEVAAARWQPPTPGWATYNVDAWWTNAGAGSGDVEMRYDRTTDGAGDTISANPTAGTAVTATAAAQNVIQVTRLASGVSIVADEVVAVNFVRLGISGADTLGNDIGLFGLRFTRAS